MDFALTELLVVSEVCTHEEREEQEREADILHAQTDGNVLHKKAQHERHTKMLVVEARTASAMMEVGSN